MLIRSQGRGDWHAPTVTAYEDESALEKLLEKSPRLLPMSNPDGPLVVVRQLGSSAGPIDLTAIDSTGEVTFVECKLRANPEIRRSIVGQLFAYASAFWQTSYEDLDRAFQLRLHKPLAEAMAAAVAEAGEPWDEATFRERVNANLTAGRVRLIFAVDNITDELRRIVEYINQHTTSDLQVVALELGYVADEGVELLVPKVFGQEAANQKSAVSAVRHWTPEDVLAALQGQVSDTALATLSRLIDWTRAHGGSFGQGGGKAPAFGAWLRVEDQLVSTWGCYSDGRVLSLNFGSLVRKVSKARVEAFADAASAIPGADSILNGLGAAQFNKYPSLPLGLLAQPGAGEILEKALADLVS